MSDTSMIRIDNKLKAQLKERAKSEGRTLEYITNEMASLYLAGNALNDGAYRTKTVIATFPFTEPTYTDPEEAA